MLDFNLLGGGGLNPLQMASQGFAQGAQNQLMQQQRQAMEQAAIQQQQQAEADQELLNRAISGDVQAQTQYALKFAKNATEAQGALGMLDKPKREARKAMAYQWDAMARTNPTEFRNMVKQRIAALENSEPTQENQQEIAVLKAGLMNDDSQLQTGITLPMVAIADPEGYDKYSKALIERYKTPLEMRELGAKAGKAEVEAKYAAQKELVDIQNKQSEIQRRLAQTNDENERRYLESQKLELDRQKLYLQASQKENKPLAAGAQKIADQFTQDALDSMSSASMARDVINQYDKLEPDYLDRALTWTNLGGVFGTKFQDLADQYEIVRKKVVQANKPGAGPISDADMKFMQKGIPEATSDPQRVREWLGKFAAIQDKSAAFDEMRANWMQQNGNMGKLKDPLELSNGDVIPAGTTVTEAAKMFRNGKVGAVIVPEDEAISKLVAAGYSAQEARKLVGGK